MGSSQLLPKIFESELWSNWWAAYCRDYYYYYYWDYFTVMVCFSVLGLDQHRRHCSSRKFEDENDVKLTQTLC